MEADIKHSKSSWLDFLNRLFWTIGFLVSCNFVWVQGAKDLTMNTIAAVQGISLLSANAETRLGQDTFVDYDAPIKTNKRK